MNEYYTFDSLAALMRRIYGLGFYKPVPEVMKITVENRFEGWSGRASETWETRITVEAFEVVSDSGKVLIAAAKETGSSVEEACRKVLSRQP